MYSFNIHRLHRLSDNDVVFYAYPKTEASKGSNEVLQNKNYTLIRYCHYLVCFLKKFKSVKITFPIAGHFYMECDKDVGLINSKARTEVATDWITVFKEARVNPAPFKVVEVDTEMIRDWKDFLEPFCLEKCGFATRPVRELRVEQLHPRLVYQRNFFNGQWTSSEIQKPLNQKSKKQNKKDNKKNTDEIAHLGIGPLMEGEFYYPPPAYIDCILPISKEKFNDLNELTKFCSTQAKQFYENLFVKKK